jgi:hypothetical protein
MFGYITPDIPELRVKEYDAYKAYYCGLCRSIKLHYGDLPRLTLTYDFTFLAILFAAMAGQSVGVAMKRCAASPFRKKISVVDDKIMTYCADMNVLFSYYKFKDDMRDDKNPFYLPIVLYMKIKINKLLKKYSDKSVIIEKELNDIFMMEKRNEKDLDLLSNKFGKIMEAVFTFDGLDSDQQKIAKWMGFNLGKWIYMIDAYDDIKKDMDKKRFNALTIDELGYSEIKEKQRDRVREYLLACLEEVSAAYGLLELKQNAEILDNIIYSGLLKKTHERCDADEKSVRSAGNKGRCDRC